MVNLLTHPRLARPELIQRLAEESAEAVSWLRRGVSLSSTLMGNVEIHETKHA